MAFIRPISEIADKFSSVTPGRATEYENGVRNPRRPWDQATAAAEGAYESGVTSAIAKKRFGKGVKAAGQNKWQQGAVEKGVSRWPVGVSMAKDSFAAGFSRYRDVIANTTLPARYPRRDPRNLQRVAVIANALGKEKEKSG